MSCIMCMSLFETLAVKARKGLGFLSQFPLPIRKKLWEASVGRLGGDLPKATCTLVGVFSHDTSLLQTPLLPASSQTSWRQEGASL